MTSSTWLQSLQALGATLDGQHVSHFGNPAAELEATATGSIMASLAHFALLEISGEDAQTFLQGQVTSDVRDLAKGVAQYSSHCTAKGRMLASFLLWREDHAFRLMLPASLAADIQKRLTMFVLRAKVRIANISEQTVLLGAAGPQADQTLGTRFALPAMTMGVSLASQGTVIRLADDRFLIACPAETAAECWSTLAAALRPVGSSCWDWLDIRARIPFIQPQTRESFIPQMVNLDRLGGIGLNKGCYVGQEVVARAHYLGKVKRHLVLAHLPQDETPVPGDGLFIQGGDSQAVGEVASSQPAPMGGQDLLAVIKDESAEGKVLCWRGADGPALTLIPQTSDF